MCYYRDTETSAMEVQRKEKSLLERLRQDFTEEIKFEQVERGKGHFCQRNKKGFDLWNLSEHSGKFQIFLNFSKYYKYYKFLKKILYKNARVNHSTGYNKSTNNQFFV